MKHSLPLVSGQRGVALVVSLILLVVITVVALSSIRFSTQEMRFSGNETFRVDAFETAQSLVDATITDVDNTPVTGRVGYTVCLPGRSCNSDTLKLTNDWLSSELAAGQADVTVQRLGPLLGPPPRGLGTSLIMFSAATFRVEASYDVSDEGLGRSEVHEGVIVLVPKST